MLAITLLSSTIACAGSTGLITTPPIKTWVEDFEPDQRRVLEETLLAMRDLEPVNLAVPADDYRASSRFKPLFGFDLSGPRLVQWWAQRVERVRKGAAWTVAVYDGERTIVVTDAFFDLSLVERLFVLVHEARHADGDGHRHTDCPRSSSPACDDHPDGAYAFQSALLFELYAYGLVDPEAARRAWRTSKTRIIRRRPQPHVAR